MASTNTKAGLSETTKIKSSPSTPRVAKLSRGVAKSEANTQSPIQNSRLSTEPSPRSANSKPSIASSKPSSSDRSSHSANSKPSAERRSPKVPTPTEKTQARIVKGSELQTRLNQIQEELKLANEQIVSLKKGRAKAVDELNEARNEAEAAIKKLDESKVEELKRDLEALKNQHAQDLFTLHSVNEELEKVKQELAAANDAESRALSQADDASKLVDIHAEKVEILSSELIRLKALLESTRENETLLNNEVSSNLSAEIEALKGELNVARSFETEVQIRDSIIERLNVDLKAAKTAESCAHSSAEEWKSKVKELEERVEEVNKLERSASVSLESAMKQLEGSNDRLHEAESEIVDLKEEIGSLEMTIRRQKTDLEEFEHQLGSAKEEISKIEKEAEELKNELETLKEEKNRVLKYKHDAASSVETLLEEKNKLTTELESVKEEEEKNKKAMESLASALHEVSTEARELKEKLLSQGDHENEAQVEDLKLVIKATNEKYETMLDEARHEINVLVNAKKDFEGSKADWEIKEVTLANHVKIMEEDMNRLTNSLKKAEEEANAAKNNEAEMENSLKEVEDEVIYLQKTLAEAKAETLKLKENLLDKEIEFEGIINENKEARMKEEISVKKIEELSKLLAEALGKKQTEENGEVSESEKDYDLLPKVIEFSEENGHRSGEDLNKALQEETNGVKDKNVNGNQENEEKKDDSVEFEFKMWESCQIEKKEAFLGKISGEAFPGKISGEDSLKEEEEENLSNKSSTEKKKKKKKTLFGKVGNLLKKKV